MHPDLQQLRYKNEKSPAFSEDMQEPILINSWNYWISNDLPA